MNSLKFKTKDQTLDLKFSYKCFRQLAEIWKLTSLTEVFEKIQGLTKSLETLEFEAFDNIADLVVCGIHAGNAPDDKENFDYDEFCEYILQNVNCLTELFQYLNESMPRQASEPAKIPAAKSLKNKRQ